MANPETLKTKTLTCAEVARITGGRLIGPGELRIGSLERLEAAGPGQLTFISDAGWAKSWASSKASAALVAPGLNLTPGEGRALVEVANPDLAVAAVMTALAPPPVAPPVGVHASAVVDRNATVDPTARIGPLCVVGAGASIGPRCVLQASVTILEGASIGADCVLWPGVVVRERCVIGQRCVLYSNVSIGSDGFGYRPSDDKRGVVRIPHFGNVILGNDVEIGASSCVDRGKFAPTTIGDGTKIDNLVQVAHNCRIGRCVLIAGCSVLGGSVTIGDGAILGGHAAVKDHVNVGAGATLAGCASVMNDIPAGATWMGYPAKEARMALRELACLQYLPELARRLKRPKGPGPKP